MARHDRARAGRAVTWADGKRRIEAIRHQFDRFTDVQHRLALAHERDAVPAIRRMIGMAAGASATLFLIFLLAGYVTRGLTSRAPAGPVHGLRLLRPDRERPGRERARRVSGECEGLRRVATLVARDASPADVFHAGAGEMGRALGAEHAMIARYDPDGMITVVGHWSAQRAPRIMPPLKGRWPVEDDTVADSVCRTGRPAHLRRDAGAVGDIGAWIRTHGIGRMTGHPVVADDRLWGMAVVLSEGPAPWPDGAERTMREFADLFGVALTGSRRRSELLASRVRLVDAADATRGRIERALHERTQQRLVAVGLTLRLVETAVPADQERLREQVSTAVRDVMEIIDGLQEIARELYPAFLTMGGIESSLRALARAAAAERRGDPLPRRVRGPGERRGPRPRVRRPRRPRSGRADTALDPRRRDRRRPRPAGQGTGRAQGSRGGPGRGVRAEKPHGRRDVPPADDPDPGPRGLGPVAVNFAISMRAQACAVTGARGMIAPCGTHPRITISRCGYGRARCPSARSSERSGTAVRSARGS
jgi:signal transduction histidine kinase